MILVARNVRREQRSGEGESCESSSAGALMVRVATLTGCYSTVMGGETVMSGTRMASRGPSVALLRGGADDILPCRNDGFVRKHRQISLTVTLIPLPDV